jgi:hypothetical protein
MTTIELKKILIQKIFEINDISFLKAIKTIIDTQSERGVITLTEVQQKEIIESRKEIEKGLFLDSISLDKEVAKWQNAR